MVMLSRRENLEPTPFCIDKGRGEKGEVGGHGGHGGHDGPLADNKEKLLSLGGVHGGIQKWKHKAEEAEEQESFPVKV